MKKSELKIIEAGNVNYLGEIPGFNDLPSNCIFNKVLTGCGATSVALGNDIPYVVRMPFTSLIKNKMEWCNERGVKALPVHYGAAGKQEIREFSGNKIMVTYDSLEKVVKALGSRIKDYKLLVDESHLLVNSGSFRYNAVNDVLRLFNLFDEYVFMTATPTKQKHLPKVLQSLPMVTVNWGNITPVTIDYSVLEYKDLYSTVSSIAYKYHVGEFPGNAYIFLNSVIGIIDIIDFLKRREVSYNDIRIICADNDENRFVLSDALGKNYTISSASDIPKKINFLTSTVFEGSDIYDTEGVTYIVSDGKPHTKYDIMTTIPQIIGRTRNTQYKNWAKLIFSPTEYFSYTTEDEYFRHVTKMLREASSKVQQFQEAGESIKPMVLDSAKSDPYLVVRDNQIEVNETAWCAQMQNFAALHTTYYVTRDNKGKPIQKNGSSSQTMNGVPCLLNSIPAEKLRLDPLEALEIGVSRPNFRELVEVYKEYHDMFQILSLKDEKRKQLIESHYPQIPKAFDTLGYDRIRAMEYNQRNIRAELLKMETLSNPAKVRLSLNRYVYAVGKRIPWETVKADLQETFDLLGIERTATAKMLESVFSVKPCKVSVNGQRVNGYKIIGKL